MLLNMNVILFDWAELYGPDILINSYKFWPVVLHYKNAGGSLIFRELAEFGLLLLSLSI